MSSLARARAREEQAKLDKDVTKTVTTNWRRTSSVKKLWERGLDAVIFGYLKRDPFYFDNAMFYGHTDPSEYEVSNGGKVCMKKGMKCAQIVCSERITRGSGVYRLSMRVDSSQCLNGAMIGFTDTLDCFLVEHFNAVSLEFSKEENVVYSMGGEMTHPHGVKDGDIITCYFDSDNMECRFKCERSNSQIDYVAKMPDPADDVYAVMHLLEDGAQMSILDCNKDNPDLNDLSN